MVVLEREITPGILGNNNSIIATLDDSTKLKVDIKLPENYVGILKNGLKDKQHQMRLIKYLW